jgi:WD40 repeat protein
MARVFISHASADAAPAAEVHRWLVGDGHQVFLDQDLSDGLLVGQEWEKRLRERLRWADAVVCVLTSAYLASVWCTAELTIAQSRGSRLLPVQAEPGLRHPLLNSVQYVDMTADAAAARARVAEALLREDAAGGAGWPDDRSPFPGLRPLDTDEHSVFFGRAAEIEQLATLLRSPAERADPAVLLVVGPSGCGKSSLVRAGLLPVMAAEAEWWTLPAILPGTTPVAALARELAASARQVGLEWTVTDVRHRLDAGDLTGLVDDLLLAVPGPRRRHLLIVVDQFEELLTQAGPEERTRFAQLVQGALAGPVQVVATLRPEFLDPLLASRELSGLPARTQTLRPLRPEALRAVIEGPADRAGVSVDAELVTRLVADTGGGDALPLLAYTLAQLADGVAGGGRLSAGRYEQLGGVQGALAGQANAALADAVTAGGRDREQVLRELLRLVTVDEQGRPTRWRIHRDDLSEQLLTELQPFVDRRLLITDSDGDQVVLGVAHEAFLTAWPPLEKAISAAASALRARRRVEQAAVEWAQHGHSPSQLWERGQLAAAMADTGAHLQSRRKAHAESPSSSERGGTSRPRRRPAVGRHRLLVADRVELSPPARDFLLTSYRRDRRRRGRSLAILSTLLALAVVAAGTAFVQQRTAVDRQGLATARLLLTRAEAALERDPRTALLLGEAADHIHPDREIRAGLVHLLLNTRYMGSLEDHSGYASDVAFAPDGRTLATAGFDQTAILWDVSDPARPRRVGAPLAGHTGPISAVAFAPDGRTLATAGADHTVILWDVSAPTRPHRLGDPLTDYTDAVDTVAFSPDGRTLATGSGDFVLLWDVTDPSRLRRLGDPLSNDTGALDDAVLSVAFSPNGHTLAAGSQDHIAVLWDVTDPAMPRRLGDPLTGHTNSVTSVAFAPDGRTLATASFDQTVILWDVTDPAMPRRFGDPLTGPSSFVNSVTFAPDGRTLATADEDATVILWDVADPAQPHRLGDPLIATSSLTAVAFSPDGHTLVTPGFDGNTSLWEVTDPTRPRPLGDPLSDTDPVLSVAFAPDGHTLATATADGSTVLWDVSDPAQPRRLGDPLSDRDAAPSVLFPPDAVAFAPDGHILATAGGDGNTILWDVTDPARPHRLGDPLTGHSTYPVLALAFAPDGHVLATASYDGTTLLWDVTDPARPRRLGDPLTGGRTLPVHSVAFAPDGHILATAGDNRTTLLWDVTDPARPHRLGDPLAGHTDSVYSMAFAPDGRTLATASQDQTVILWDVTDPARPHRLGDPLTGHTNIVKSVAFVPDGRILATASTDGSVLLWDVTDLARPRRLGDPLTGQSDEGSLGTAPDGHTLATAGQDKAVVLWDLSRLNWLLDHPLERACTLTGGGLDRAEWARYVPGLDYVNACAA